MSRMHVKKRNKRRVKKRKSNKTLVYESTQHQQVNNTMCSYSDRGWPQDLTEQQKAYIGYAER